MNDPTESSCLAALPQSGLVNGLNAAVEGRPAPQRDQPPAPAGPWTHRFKPARQPARYELYDHLWLSSATATRLAGAGIGRRTRLTGDGSDHDPAWVDLNL